MPRPRGTANLLVGLHRGVAGAGLRAAHTSFFKAPPTVLPLLFYRFGTLLRYLNVRYSPRMAAFLTFSTAFVSTISMSDSPSPNER